MDETMMSKLSTFAHNREMINRSWFLQDSRITAACACLYAITNREITTEEIKHAQFILKGKHGILSSFRGYTEPAVCCILADAEDPEYLLEQCEKAYACLKEKNLWMDAHHAERKSHIVTLCSK